MENSNADIYDSLTGVNTHVLKILSKFTKHMYSQYAKFNIKTVYSYNIAKYR